MRICAQLYPEQHESLHPLRTIQEARVVPCAVFRFGIHPCKLHTTLYRKAFQAMLTCRAAGIEVYGNSAMMASDYYHHGGSINTMMTNDRHAVNLDVRITPDSGCEPFCRCVRLFFMVAHQTVRVVLWE